MDFSFKTIIGLLLILWGLGIVFNFNVGRFIFPLFLVSLGILLLFNQQNIGREDTGTSNENMINASSVFSSVNRKVTSEEFKGGKIDVVFGSGEIDLRDAKLGKGETVSLEMNAVFGGIKIFVPKTWKVRSSVSAVFGGFENKTTPPTSGKEQGILELKGATVFGGGEIIN